MPKRPNAEFERLAERLLAYCDIRRNDPRESREVLRDLLEDELHALVALECERCRRAARRAIHSVPPDQRISADILMHATDTAIGWPNVGCNRLAPTQEQR